MNKHIVSTIALAVFVTVTTSPALAKEDSSSSDLRREFKQEIKDLRKDNRDEIASRSQAFQASLKAKRDAQREIERKSRLTKFWKKTAERLQKLINREKKIADKISARIDRLAAAGRDPAKITELRNALAAARLKIDAAQTALNDAIAQIKQMITDGKPMADIVAKARELHKGVVGKIREAHKALIQVLVATRGLSVTPTPSPSPSATPTPTP